MKQKAPMKELNQIAQAIYDKKGSNIIALDVKDLSTLADYIVIAEGNIDRHLRAIALEIQDTLYGAGLKPLFTEGMQSGDWVVIDYGEIVVHLMLSEFREKYELEKLWKKASIIDLKIEVKKET